MNSALKYYDDDGDIMLQPQEAEAAADQFRRIADVDRDGRVTPEEYRAARTLIMAR
jgi:TPR repeat protein